MAKKMALGSRPKNDYEKKLVGIVELVTSDKSAKFTLTEDGKVFKGGSDSFKCLIADLPKRPKLPLNDRTGKQYRIRMNSEGDEIEAITPVRGMHPAKLVDLGKRANEDADPIPYERIFGEGTDKENSHLEFFAVYEITQGAFKGVQVPAYYLHYKFEEDPNDEGFTRFAGNIENKKATRLHQLVDWGSAHDLWDEPIRWKEVDDGSILPELLDRALTSDKEVNLVFDKGYIQSIQPADEYEEVDDESDEETDDEFDEKFPVKKTAQVTDEVDDDVKEVKIKSKAPKGKAEVKKAPAKKLPKKSDEDDDL